MFRLLILIMFFVLAPFGKGSATMKLKNCTLLNTSIQTKNLEEHPDKASTKIQLNAVSLLPSDTADAIEAMDVPNDQDSTLSLRFYAAVLSDSFWIYLSQKQNAKSHYLAEDSAAFPARYLLYQQLKIPFS